MKKMVLLTSVHGFSGIAGPIYRELERQWELVATIDPYRVPPLRRCSYLAASFSARRELWKREYHERMDRYNRSPLAFRQRTARCADRLSRVDENYDVVFQLSCMFLASHRRLTKPYAVYLDRTVAMAQRYFPDRLRSLGPGGVKELDDLTRQVLHAADIVFTFNDVATDSVIDDYGIENGKVVGVGSGVNTAVSPNLAKKHDNLVLAVCSDFERHKGRLSLEAFRVARGSMPEARFVFVGDRSGEVADGVEFLPFLPYEELIELYMRASIVLMPASLGGMQTITEAMAQKCVCIANAENPYTRGLIIDKENGLLFSGDDPAQIGAMIVRVLKDRALIDSMGHKAVEHILAGFTWTKAVSKISERLRELI